MARPAERSAAALLSTVGATPAAKPNQLAKPPRDKLNRPIAPRRGRARPGEGWAAVEPPMPVYHAATHEIGGLYPLLAANGVPPVGARIGYDTQSGSAFYCHPVEWVLQGLSTNANMIVFGEVGRGKSSTVVALLLRLMPFGVKTVISGDVKGEYTPLLRALDLTPIVLGHGHRARLNPLDLGPLASRWNGWSASRQRAELDGVLGRWVRLLVALAEAQRYSATVTDEAVLSRVLRRLVGAEDGYTRLRPVTIPDVATALANPDDAVWQGARFASRREFLDHLRSITDALANLVSGPLAGLFDEHTNFTLDWTAPAQSMDLSRLRSHGDQALAIALTCLGAWSSLATDLRQDGEIRIVVRDEVWRSLRLGPRAVQAVDSDLRLSRTEQTIQVLVGHKPSDFLSSGSAGSQVVAIAKDLLALCSIRILFGQSTRVAEDLTADFTLNEKEHAAVTGWAMERKGRALWKIEGSPGHTVQTVLSAVERRYFDTNAQLRPATGQGR